MLWNTLIPNHKWTTCSYIVVQYQCQSDGVEWAMGTLLGVTQRCISIQVWKRCDWTGPAIFWGPKLSTPKLAEAHYCTICNGPVRNSKCRTRLLVPLLKKREKKTMNPASCNFSQATSQSPYLKGWPCLVRRGHSRVPSAYIFREKNLTCMEY